MHSQGAVAPEEIVSVTAKGLSHEGCLCPPESAALACAKEWEEAVPCDCGCHGPPVEATGHELRALVGFPLPGDPLTEPSDVWARIVTDTGMVLMVPTATVEAIGGVR